jgi:glycosyltransferase involved in cell wall biosynthesis
MRILFVINRLIQGGAETQVISLSRELVSRGHSVLVYTLHADNPRADELAGSAVKVVADTKHTKFDPGLVLRIRQTIRDFNADIVHGFLLEGNLYARLAAARTPVPALNSERNDNYQIPFRHKLALALTRHLASGVVANTHAGARFAQDLFGLPPEQVDVVWNGLKEAEDRRKRPRTRALVREFFPSTPTAKVAVVVAMFRPQKDHVLALHTAQVLVSRDPSWRVLFVGDSLPHTEKYKQQVLRVRDELGLADVVQFAGLRQDVPEILKQSNLLLSTSLHEGFPNVVIEAMSAGTPVVSTDYSDIKQILPNAWQVIEGRNPSDLADAVVRADGERARISRQQRKWLRSNATLAMEVDRLEAVYRKYIAA